MTRGSKGNTALMPIMFIFGTYCECDSSVYYAYMTVGSMSSLLEVINASEKGKTWIYQSNFKSSKIFIL